MFSETQAAALMVQCPAQPPCGAHPACPIYRTAVSGTLTRQTDVGKCIQAGLINLVLSHPFADQVGAMCFHNILHFFSVFKQYSGKGILIQSCFSPLNRSSEENNTPWHSTWPLDPISDLGTVQRRKTVVLEKDFVYSSVQTEEESISWIWSSWRSFPALTKAWFYSVSSSTFEELFVVSNKHIIFTVFCSKGIPDSYSYTHLCLLGKQLNTIDRSFAKCFSLIISRKKTLCNIPLML